MNRKLEEWVRVKLQPMLKKERVILLVLTGMLLLVISLPSGNKGEKERGIIAPDIKAVTEREGAHATPMTDGDGETVCARDYSEEEYVADLERKLREVLSLIEGAGEVHVMITLAESRRLVVEKDLRSTQKQTEETLEDKEGGRKSGEEILREESTVYSAFGNGKEPFVVKQIYPRVEGVVVAAQGAGTGHVRSEISEAVQALFGLDAHKVKVLKSGNIPSHAGIK